MKRILTRGVMLAAASTLALGLAGCGADDPDDAAAGSGTASSSTAPADGPSGGAAGGGSTPSDQPFGAGCAAIPAEGEGSLPGMADDPLATAAGNNPLLSRLVEAVAVANLVDTLNSTDDITVLAPANSAFEAVPADQLNAVLADSAQLTALLTHHAIGGRLAPGELAGTHTTLNGDEVTIAGSGESFTIDGTLTQAPASVICGNVQTANATVYVIDQVLAPAPA